MRLKVIIQKAPNFSSNIRTQILMLRIGTMIHLYINVPIMVIWRFAHCLLVVDRVQNLSGSGLLANQCFGFGFIGFQRLVNFRVYRVFGFENVPRIFNFFTIFWSKIFRFGKCSAIFTTNFQIPVKIITFQYILVKKSLCRFFSRKN